MPGVRSHRYGAAQQKLAKSSNLNLPASYKEAMWGQLLLVLLLAAMQPTPV
jgi:hypothetical protein